MGYSLRKSDRKMARAVRRIARDRIADSLAVLDGQQPPDAAGIHTLRKNIKKLRALLRLIRPVFDDYKRENAALREAGQRIGGLRDRDVMLALFDQVAAGQSEVQPLRQRLAARFTPGEADPATALAGHREALLAARRRVDDWDFDAKGFDLLAPGLERGIDEARSALHGWRKSGAAEDLHRLRKRIKATGYHAQLLAPVWPAMMKPHRAQIDRLGELLGDSRDHALLADHLAALGGPATLTEPARHRAATLEREAEALARRLLVEPGHAVSARWRGWWDLWHG